jgi:hypothetical protein
MSVPNKTGSRARRNTASGSAWTWTGQPPPGQIRTTAPLCVRAVRRPGGGCLGLCGRRHPGPGRRGRRRPVTVAHEGTPLPGSAGPQPEGPQAQVLAIATTGRWADRPAGFEYGWALPKP